MGLVPFQLPRLYVIADSETLARQGMTLGEFARQMDQAGIELLQLRNKADSPEQILADAAMLGKTVPATRLLLNDCVDLVLPSCANGVHLGQSDSPIGKAREVLGVNAIIGLSTHTDAQVVAGNRSSADYLAIGPVFGTQTKLDAASAVGLGGVRRARDLTSKLLVAIGGITRENCRSVIDAGADSVAVISGLFCPGESVEQVARDFLRILS